MKNVAKCDTWCELQNPANHRIFERKLRPRPSGRGHACLGVTPRVAPPPLARPRSTGVGSAGRGMRTLAYRAHARRAEELGPPAGRARRVVDPVLLRAPRSGRPHALIVVVARPKRGGRRGKKEPSRERGAGPPAPLARSDRDPRSGGATRRV
jgi:hypothetical protein